MGISIKKLSIALAVLSSGYAAAGDYENTVSIYGWIPNLDADFKYHVPDNPYSGASDEVDSKSSEKLDMVFMGSYGLRKENYSFLSDIIYLKTSNHKEVAVLKTGNVESKHEIKAWMLGFYGGYNVLNTPRVSMDAIGGLRYFSLSLDATVDLTKNYAPSVSPSTHVTDAIVGVRGFVNIKDNWYMPYHFDIGAGDSDLTWQAYTGVGYHFGWGDVVLSYRAIHYDVGDSNLVEEFDLRGPQLGAIFRF